MQEQNKTIIAFLMAGIPQEKKRKVIEKEKTSASAKALSITHLLAFP